MHEITLSLAQKQLIPYYTYRAFGLRIKSAFPIEELLPADIDTVDVRIKYGITPEKLAAVSGEGVLFQANRNEFLFRLKTVGAYLVTDGTDIIVQQLNNSSLKDLNLFLLGSAIGAIIHQRGLLPIHGSTVVKNGKAIIISGVSGAGKSSIAATLINRGYELLADDISVLESKKNTLLVQPGIPHIKLWQDVIEKMKDNPENYEKVRDQLKKYRKPVLNAFLNTPAPPEKMIILNSKNLPGFSHEYINGFEKFNAIKNHTYRYRFVESMDRISDHFSMANQLANAVDIIKLNRPSSPILLEELADEIEKLI